MMKLLPKPTSSPGRVDNFPPLLMRFLRSNVGSKSRGRSRSSPTMFLRKAPKSSSSSSSTAAAIESTQEPSSPKVTCMGQVRVGRSRKTLNRKPGTGRELDEERPETITRCAWFSHSLLCNCPAGGRWKKRRSNGGGDLRLVSFTRPWRDCSSLFQLAGRRRRRPDVSREGEDSLEGEMEPKFRNNRVISELREVDHSELKNVDEEDEEAEAGAGDCVASSFPCSPPKNALLLTRCRSAPHRSSSLACRFWGSPLDGTGEAQRRQQNREESAGKDPKPLVGAEVESRVHPEEEEEEATPAADDEEKAEFLEEIMESIVRPAAKIGELKLREEGRGLRPPPRLIRCRSGPASTAA